MRHDDTKIDLSTENKFWFLYMVILIEACVIAWLLLPEVIG